MPRDTKGITRAIAAQRATLDEAAAAEWMVTAGGLQFFPPTADRRTAARWLSEQELFHFAIARNDDVRIRWKPNTLNPVSITTRADRPAFDAARSGPATHSSPARIIRPHPTLDPGPRAFPADSQRTPAAHEPTTDSAKLSEQLTVANEELPGLRAGRKDGRPGRAGRNVRDMGRRRAQAAPRRDRARIADAVNCARNIFPLGPASAGARRTPAGGTPVPRPSSARWPTSRAGHSGSAIPRHRNDR